MIATALLILALQAAPGAPGQPAQPATIEGTVVRVGSNEPVVRAQIILTRVNAAPTLVAAPGAPGAPAAPAPASRPGAAPAPAASADIPPVLTDNRGRFLVKDLPPGTYRIAAAKNGFTRQDYGQRTARTPGTPVAVAAGQALKDIAFQLTPAATISGRISDDMGEPLAGVTVQLMRSTYTAAGRKNFLPVVNAKTNDLGEYRLYWITPGTYYLDATTGGTYLDSLMQSVINSAATAARAQDTSGGATANASQAGLDGLLGRNTNEVVEPGFATTYFPGTIDTTRATSITIAPGTDLRSVDFTLARQQMFRIRGRVFDARTSEIPQTAIVLVTNPAVAGAPKPASYDPTAGTFEARDIPPGEWIVIGQVVNTAGGGAPAIGVAQQTLTVSGNDIENVALTVRGGVSVPGTVNIEGAAAGAGGLERLRMRLAPTSDSLINAGQPAPVAADGSFTLSNVSMGDYRVGIIGMPPNSYIKSARLGRNDIMQDPLNLSGDVSGSLEVLISPNGGQISGTLVDKASKPVSATQVALIPDRLRDRRDLFKVAATDQSGHFTFQGLPPGDYRLYAWEDMDPFAYNDPEVLRQFETQAKIATIQESGTANVEVKIIPAVQ